MTTTGSNRYDDVPAILRWVIVSIKEIGFPIVGCVLMFYLAEVSIRNLSDNVTRALNQNTEAVTALRHFLTKKYDN